MLTKRVHLLRQRYPETNGPMNLSAENIGNIQSKEIAIPSTDYFKLPEKVLQFGTGVLLRGLPDYFIDKANKQGIFNGRVVIVKSTRGGDTDVFARQNNLYTLCVRGIDNGKKVEENSINASISRVLAARSDWQEILQCAANPDMQVVISNTTEVGITLVKESIQAVPPGSFPGKLLAFLHKRYTVFQGDSSKGMVIIPTELIPDNGTKLKEILIELAQFNKLEPAFIEWLQTHNHFCNSLVDRIVPGKLPAPKQKEMEEKTGYTDDLMIMSEVYRLWAIESDSAAVKEILSFHQVDEGVIIAPDINIFRELKLRLLNGSHTFSCGLAHLAGFSTVKESMGDEQFFTYISQLMFQEMAPAITDKEITATAAKEFAQKVLDRFRNPHIEHLWLNITMQYSSKMKMRNIPVLLKHYAHTSTVPEHMALGFAAHLLFMRVEKGTDGNFYGSSNGKKYQVNDDNAAYYAAKWSRMQGEALVKKILGDAGFWGTDLSALPGFAAAVTAKLQELQQEGAMATIRNIQQHPHRTVEA